jgi:hypothetical protein
MIEIPDRLKQFLLEQSNGKYANAYGARYFLLKNNHLVYKDELPVGIEPLGTVYFTGRGVVSIRDMSGNILWLSPNYIKMRREAQEVQQQDERMRREAQEEQQREEQQQEELKKRYKLLEKVRVPCTSTTFAGCEGDIRQTWRTPDGTLSVLKFHTIGDRKYFYFGKD